MGRHYDQAKEAAPSLIRRRGKQVFVNGYGVRDPTAKEILAPSNGYNAELAPEFAAAFARRRLRPGQRRRIPGGPKILQAAGALLSIGRRLAGRVLWVFVAVGNG